MDPRLWELQRDGEPAEEIMAIVRLREGSELPPQLTIVTRFGEIATCRLSRRDIAAARAHPSVQSLKAPHALVPDVIESLGESGSITSPVAASDERRPDLPETGDGVVIGIVDWGCDFTYPSLRSADGTTRLGALWDQSQAYDPAHPNRFGYGRIHDAEAINRALESSDPFAALGYGTFLREGDDAHEGAHGTHVADIAAGNGRAGGPLGMAPHAEIVFVHLASRKGGFRNLGDSAALLEALAFIEETAGARPFVVNLSMGNMAGPHDGSTLVEQAIDHFLLEAPGRMLCQSCGNYFRHRTHTTRWIRPGETTTISWNTAANDATPNQIEIWYSRRDQLRARLIAPSREESAWCALGEQDELRAGETDIARLYHRAEDPNNLDHQIAAFQYPEGGPGEWKLEIFGHDVADGRLHAWIERDVPCNDCQSQFSEDDAVSTGTLNTICNGFRTLTVGAYDAHVERALPAPFSSVGPTRDGRRKPDLSAPGVHVLAARSAHGEEHGRALVRKSGTSMAAPHVTGTVALMLEAAGGKLANADVRRLVLEAASPVGGEEQDRFGHGTLDVARAVELAREFRGEGDMGCAHCDQEAREELATVAAGAELLDMEVRESDEQDELESVLRTAIETVGPDDELFETIAYPGRSLDEPIQLGDVVYERIPGQGQRLAGVVEYARAGDISLITPDAEQRQRALRITRSDLRLAPEYRVARLRPTEGTLHESTEAELEAAEEVTIPPREPSMPGGRAFMKTLYSEKTPSNLQTREDALVAQLVAGNFPNELLRWKQIDLSFTDTTGKVTGTKGKVLTGTVWVMPDYVCVGSNSDYIHVPLDCVSAQRVADAYGCVLPTPKICHQVYLQTPATHRIGAIARKYYPVKKSERTYPWDQDSTAAYIEHSEAIQKEMAKRGAKIGELVAGHKKDVVLSTRLVKESHMLAFQGFYDAKGFPHEPCHQKAYAKKGVPQPGCPKDIAILAHPKWFSDYSQGVRLVRPVMRIDGVMRSVAGVMADPVLSYIVNVEGPVPSRIPAAPKPAGAAQAGAAAKKAEHAEDQEQAAASRPYRGVPFSRSTFAFRCATPLLPISASLLPLAQASGLEASVEAVLTRHGLSSAQLKAFKQAQAVAPLTPLMEILGEACFAEVFTRLRYPAERILNPPFSKGSAKTLIARALLCIPGHFRELARKASGTSEAFALENLGWLLAEVARQRVVARKGQNWWLPSPPRWSTKFPRPLPRYTKELTDYLNATPEVVDSTVSAAAFQGQEKIWTEGLPGKQWLFETGARRHDTRPAGQPYYPDVRVWVPPPNMAEVSKVEASMRAIFASETNESKLRAKLGVHIGEVKLVDKGISGTLELIYGDFPQTVPANRSKALRFMKPICFHASALFQTFRDLGWNDLVFQEIGAFEPKVVTGGKSPSNHSFGLAIDVNSFENPQALRKKDEKGVIVGPWIPAFTTVDPRVVAVFESFGFTWGRCICEPGSDPMHFEFLTAQRKTQCGP